MKKFDIGQVFLGWEVVEEADHINYRYKCRCVSCGKVKIFNKYTLTRGRFSPCKDCGHKFINVDLIRKHWNTELNGKVFDDPEKFNIDRKYWFICDNNHSFKSALKNFSLDNCEHCNYEIKEGRVREENFEITQIYFKKLFDGVETIKPNILVIEDVKLLIIVNENDRHTNYKNYYKDESSFLDEFMNEKDIELLYKAKGFKIKRLWVDEKLENTLVSIENIVKEIIL